MNTLDERVKTSFDQVTVPEGLNDKTLERIYGVATEQGKGSVEQPAREAGLQSTRILSTRRKYALRAALSLAACVLAAVIGVGAYNQLHPTAFVQLDMNPSIELQVNKYDKVVGVEALNDDGQQVLDAVDVEGDTYEDAVQEITSSDAFLEYAGENSYLEINITCDNATQAEELLSVSEQQVQQLPCPCNCRYATAEEREEAWAAGMGVGRYRLACQLIELDDSLTLEDCAQMSMWELRSRIEALGGEVPTDIGPGSGYCGGAGYGGGYGQGYGAGQGQGYGVGQGQGNGASAGSGPGAGQGYGAGGGNGYHGGRQ